MPCHFIKASYATGLDRLETTSSVVQSNHTEVWSTGGTLVCIMPIHSVSMLLQLETGSISRGNGYFQPAMGTDEGLCEPSMVPDVQGSHTSEESPGSDNFHSSSIDRPTLVLCSAGDAMQLPSTATPLTKFIPTDVRHKTDRPTTSTGRMA